MPRTMTGREKLPYLLVGFVTVQIVCAVFFLADVIVDFRTDGIVSTTDWHLYVETFVVLSLCSAIFFEVQYLWWLLRNKAHLERSVSIATAAVHDVIEAHFETWKLTPAEKDIATFLVKGLSIAEIGELRGSAEGTVKSHLNSIYRKSGASGRGELLSQIIDSLIGDGDNEKRHPR